MRILIALMIMFLVGCSKRTDVKYGTSGKFFGDAIATFNAQTGDLIVKDTKVLGVKRVIIDGENVWPSPIGCHNDGNNLVCPNGGLIATMNWTPITDGPHAGAMYCNSDLDVGFVFSAKQWLKLPGSEGCAGRGGDLNPRHLQ